MRLFLKNMTTNKGAAKKTTNEPRGNRSCHRLHEMASMDQAIAGPGGQGGENGLVYHTKVALRPSPAGGLFPWTRHLQSRHL